LNDIFDRIANAKDGPPATDRQMEFLNRLRRQDGQVPMTERLTVAEASEQIDDLRASLYGDCYEEPFDDRGIPWLFDEVDR